MKHDHGRLSGVFCVVAGMLFGLPAMAQDRGGDDTDELDALEVIGTRIKRVAEEGLTPVQTITAEDIAREGLSSIGDILQRLSVSSSALNTKFNSAGNFGFPPDGGGVGSGSTTISLRNLGAKRALVLVDGLRWVNESSASGVSAAVDLNTIPASAIERVEILTDGASSLYGSDAIAGVVNIVTKKKQDGGRVGFYAGDYTVGNGLTQSANVSLGGGGNGFGAFFDVSHYEQKRISSNETEQSRFPVPGTGLSNGSSATPTTRSLFVDPNNNDHGGLCSPAAEPPVVCNITANGTAAGPDFTHTFPDDFHRFVGAVDRFNFAPYNLLLTPQERTGIFSQASYDLSDYAYGWIKGLYQTRHSVNQAAPEPIFIGPGAGTGGLADTVGVDASNPFNPFGYSLDPNSNLIFAGRRPLEGGPRVFSQDVDTRYLAAGAKGSLDWRGRTYFWDVNAANSRNRATQTVQGTYNIAHIKRALGPVADCTAPCVPLNFFGGPGTITPEMLNYISFIENDRSLQEINLWTANLSGQVFKLPAGEIGVAVGIEHRLLSGSYAPDSVVTAGETNGVPSLPTSGSYTVDEAYVELGVPLLADRDYAKDVELSLATRFSDYSTFGQTTNSKFGLRWEASEQFVARATVAEGFRAPSVGELFGSPSRFDATLADPCSNAAEGSQTRTNCEALGVTYPYEQANAQISVRTGGSRNLQPETADSLTAGFVYSPAWARKLPATQRLDFDLTYYSHELDGAIQAADAQTQLNRCVQTLNAAFCNGITRGTSGDINGFNNTLQNFGRIETAGFDLGVDWAGVERSYGRIGANWQTTLVNDYKAIATDTGLLEPRRVGIEVADSAIPEYRSKLRVNWAYQAIETSWAMRYISSLTESCAGANGFPICDNSAADRNSLASIVYNDLQVQWKRPYGLDLNVSAGINNVLDEDPPVCLSCSLNGYDASTYDLPGQFFYAQGTLDF